jgi:hypothetical protein
MSLGLIDFVAPKTGFALGAFFRLPFRMSRKVTKPKRGIEDSEKGFK